MWLIWTYQTTVQSDSHSHLLQFRLLQNQHADHTLNTREIAISCFFFFVLRRSPLHWLTMNLIHVKFNLERTSSCKWKVVKQYGNKEENLAYNHDCYDRRRAQSRVIVEIQGKVSSQPSKKESMHIKRDLENVTTQNQNSPRIWSSVNSDCSKRN